MNHSQTSFSLRLEEQTHSYFLSIDGREFKIPGVNEVFSKSGMNYSPPKKEGEGETPLQRGERFHRVYENFEMGIEPSEDLSNWIAIKDQYQINITSSEEVGLYAKDGIVVAGKMDLLGTSKLGSIVIDVKTGKEYSKNRMQAIVYKKMFNVDVAMLWYHDLNKAVFVDEDVQWPKFLEAYAVLREYYPDYREAADEICKLLGV